MSFSEARQPQDLGAARLNTVQGAPILHASVEATRVSDLCTGEAPQGGARARILAWLAEGAREVTWALCSLRRERWAASPPARPGDWPALRHVRHIALREAYVTLPSVRRALGEAPGEAAPSPADLAHADAAWDPVAAIESAEAIVRGLGATRFELLQRLESAPDAVWERPVPAPVASDPSGSTGPVQLEWVMLHARQHELEHLAAIWRVVLYWDRVSPSVVAAAGTPIQEHHRAGGLPLHPADRLEESD